MRPDRIEQVKALGGARVAIGFNVDQRSECTRAVNDGAQS